MLKNDLRLHFGLGEHDVMNTVEIQWPSGKKDLFSHLPADFIYTIDEDKGVQSKQPFALGSGGKASFTSRKWLFGLHGLVFHRHKGGESQQPVALWMLRQRS